jgi:hypothetical protein
LLLQFTESDPAIALSHGQKENVALNENQAVVNLKNHSHDQLSSP